MSDHRCRWAGSDQPRLLRTHLTDCEDARCDGCQPCPERHCRICGRAHVTSDGRGTDQTCADCLAATRDDLAGCWAGPEMVVEAEARGVDSEAAMLAGPTAIVETWQRRHRLIAIAGAEAAERSPAHRAAVAWMADCRDEAHPLWVLGTWEELVRDHLDQPSDDLVTGHAARDYLDGHLTRLAHDPEFPFEDMARELRGCRGHLEDVLHDSRQPERGAPCPACGKASLVKDYGTKPEDDRWTCPKCGQWWTDHDYRVKVDGIYVGVAKALTDTDMERRTRVKAATVRQWAARGHVAKRGRSADGRTLYDVDQVLALRDTREAG